MTPAIYMRPLTPKPRPASKARNLSQWFQRLTWSVQSKKEAQRAWGQRTYLWQEIFTG
jgi:hypothetical protein